MGAEWSRWRRCGSAEWMISGAYRHGSHSRIFGALHPQRYRVPVFVIVAAPVT